MKTYVRTGIVVLAGSVAFGTAGFAVANASGSTDDRTPQDTVVKREDTATSWVQSTDLDDDPSDDDLGVDGPTHHTVNTVNTKNTVNTANTKNTVDTKNTAKTVNTAPTKNTANTSPTGDTDRG